MKEKEILRQLAAGKQDRKHLGRLYLFASGSILSDPFVNYLKKEIERRLRLDEAGFYALFAQTSADWSLRMARIEAEALNLASITRFEKSASQKPAPKGSQAISLAKAGQLLASLYSMTLQKLSMQTGKNHLKTRELRRMEALLKDPNELGGLQKAVSHPFLKALHGQWSVTGEDFLFHSLALIQLLADYLQADLPGKGLPAATGKKQVIKEQLKRLKAMQLAEIKEFLDPSFGQLHIPENALSISDRPLAGLEKTIEE